MRNMLFTSEQLKKYNCSHVIKFVTLSFIFSIYLLDLWSKRFLMGNNCGPLDVDLLAVVFVVFCHLPKCVLVHVELRMRLVP